ncbi:MAG TPA: flagellar filament capping protein FliD [Chloroflexota bacterium]|jgi:flagellar hook-associated protein 2|nr:flagellar filament capping protein FliD [Chloroflexota bacterium]
MASGIAFTGLASGLNSSQIIDALLSVDKSRVDGLRAQKAAISTRVSSIGTVKSKLSALMSKLEALRFQSQVLARTATSSNSAAVTANATSEAALGPFDVTVDQLATATRRQGTVGLGQESFDPLKLADSGLVLAPTAGRFTVNGVAINVANPTRVQDFVDAINAAEGSTGVRADYLLDGLGQPTGVRIYNTTNPAGTAIKLGSAGDTSNFLTAAKLDTATQVGDQIASTTTLGRALVSSPLASARLAGTLSQATGSFTINGVSFNWDSATSSINSLVVAINSSAANVSASYDAVSNRLNLVSKSTGAQSIAVSDTTGNLLQVLGATDLAGASETLGQNALYRVNTIAGGAQQSSASNTISGVVPGVTFTLLSQGATSTITVGQDVDKPLAAMKDFIAAFNDAAEYIRAQTKSDSDKAKGGPLQGESSIRMVGAQLRNIAVGGVPTLGGPYKSLMDVGVSSGAVGSAAGTTNNLQIDEKKFKDALSANPQAVYDALDSVTAGSEGIFQQMRTYLNGVTLPGGILTSMTDTSNARQSYLDLRIEDSERRLDQKRSRLEAQFARMETAVAKLQAQGNRLNSQLAGMQRG